MNLDEFNKEYGDGLEKVYERYVDANLILFYELEKNLDILFDMLEEDEKVLIYPRISICCNCSNVCVKYISRKDYNIYLETGRAISLNVLSGFKLHSIYLLVKEYVFNKNSE